MSFGKYSRADGRKTSNCYSTSIVLVFVSLCLVGTWMMMSSSVTPAVDSSSEKASDTTGQQMNEGQTKKSQDSLPDETVKVESSSESNQDDSSPGVENISEKDSENSTENNEEEKGKTESEGRDVEVKKDENTEQAEEVSVSNDKDANGEESPNNDDQQESRETTGESKEETNDNSGSELNAEETKQEGESDGTEENKGTEGNSDKEGSESGKDQELKEETASQSGAFSTQSAESLQEKEIQKSSYSWKVCNVTAGPDYIPCLDNLEAIRKLHGRSHYQHRERHCPEQAPTCLVPMPEGYKSTLKWPKSRDKIWFANVPHTKLAEYKGHQNWVKVSGEYLIFPGGGTQFKNGVQHYIDLIEKTLPDIAWGKRTRVILDVGCGVASFGGYLFDKDVLAMSLAPKDEHEAQVQFALERGIPAISAVMGTKRLPYPSRVFDVVHCARCRVPWHIEGGKLLLELNRVLRPGGYFVWSATPVYQNKSEDVGIWKAMTKLTKAMCWDLVKIGKDKLNEVAVAIYRKPTSNECYDNRVKNDPPLCEESDNADAAWNVSMQACMHRIPEDASDRGSQWPANWPSRVKKAPYWLKSSEAGVYGKSAPKDFATDYEHWKNVVANSYMNGLGIDWSSVRNIIDMRAIYGGFAAALKDLNVWVMNVVPIDSPDTLPIIYERGLFGIYHNWCESFNTYPRTYDLLHADHLFSDVKKRCNLVAVIAEVDRVLRPGGKLIVRDKAETVAEIETMAKSLHWEVRMTYTEGKEGLLCVQKTTWRPTEVETVFSSIE